ncbi:MAG: CHAD domain-containing protein [Candidatus Binatia bacterium]
MAGPKYQTIDLRPTENVGDAFELVANAYGRDLDRHCSAIQRYSDPETIHRMRITIRRLLTGTSALTTAPRDRAHIALRLKLHRLQKALNGLRDIDTWLEILSDNAKELTAKDLARLRKATLRMRARELAECRQLCRSRPYRAFGPEIEAWVRGGSWRSKLSLMPITDHARQHLARLDHKIRKHSKSISKLDEAATHKLRIRVKKARYAAELFAPLFQNRAAKTLKRYSAAIERLQSALGALTDLASHQRIAKNMFARDEFSQDPALPFFAGMVVGQEVRSRTKLSKAARKACDQYRKMARPGTWMVRHT